MKNQLIKKEVGTASEQYPDLSDLTLATTVTHAYALMYATVWLIPDLRDFPQSLAPLSLHRHKSIWCPRARFAQLAPRTEDRVPSRIDQLTRSDVPSILPIPMSVHPHRRVRPRALPEPGLLRRPRHRLGRRVQRCRFFLPTTLPADLGTPFVKQQAQSQATAGALGGGALLQRAAYGLLSARDTWLGLPDPARLVSHVCTEPSRSALATPFFFSALVLDVRLGRPKERVEAKRAEEALYAGPQSGGKRMKLRARKLERRAPSAAELLTLHEHSASPSSHDFDFDEDEEGHTSAYGGTARARPRTRSERHFSAPTPPSRSGHSEKLQLQHTPTRLGADGALASRGWFARLVGSTSPHGQSLLAKLRRCWCALGRPTVRAPILPAPDAPPRSGTTPGMPDARRSLSLEAYGLLSPEPPRGGTMSPELARRLMINETGPVAYMAALGVHTVAGRTLQASVFDFSSIPSSACLCPIFPPT
ncbi:hypothetical protein B0H15DRAFT_955770 [Mycena belliarum]|uniref:Uncharacterized protein n=1 Tax=Mycena belliarum TaxID=1033014 RepID=A0AAD6XFV5_9AGAR|nr:hypothetical protein B0H15DRAFT_955770 [Mycena belliae]